MQPNENAEHNKLDRVVGFLAERFGTTREAIAAEVASVDRAELEAKRRELVAGRAAIAAVPAAARVRQQCIASEERRAAELRKVIETARAALAQIETKVFDLRAEATLEEQARVRELARIDADLGDSADPQIAGFVRELQAECDVLTRNGPSRVVVKNRLTDERQVESDAPSLNARLVGIRQAIAAAEALQLIVATPAEVGERLQAIRAQLPPLGMVKIPRGENGWEPLEGWVPASAGTARPATASRGPRPTATPPKGGWWKPRGRV